MQENFRAGNGRPVFPEPVNQVGLFDPDALFRKKRSIFRTSAAENRFPSNEAVSPEKSSFCTNSG